MGTLAANATANNGGFTSLGRKTYNYVIRGAEPPVATRAVTVASGQVLKAMSWVESNTAGKLIAHAPLVEVASIEFAAIDAAETIILGGLTWTAGGSGTTAAQLATAFASIADSTGYADLADRTDGGSFTAGTLTGWDTQEVEADGITVLFTATTAAAMTDLADTGTGDDPTVTIVQYAASNKVAGLLAMDVNATSGDTEAQMYISGNFWEEAINWGVNVAVDTVENSDGTTTACTAYETGCYTSLLRQKLVEQAAGGTNFQIGTFTDGEVEA